jgi:hypothetical protein
VKDIKRTTEFSNEKLNPSNLPIRKSFPPVGMTEFNCVFFADRVFERHNVFVFIRLLYDKEHQISSALVPV